MKIMSYFAFITLLTLSCSEKKEDLKPPNIIYILADDLGYGDLGCYNPNGKILTPNLDRLAESGVRFTDAHTSSGVCTPTRYGILTGRYNWRSSLKSGVLTGKSTALIESDRSTVASILKQKNYNTAAIGKWHLGWDWAVNEKGLGDGEGWNPGEFSGIDFSKPVSKSPNDLGFDYTYLLPASLDIAPYIYLENGLSTTVPDTVTVNKGKYSWWREGPTAPDFIHEEVTQNFFAKAENYVKERAPQDEAYFLYLPLPSPHTPILPSAEWQGKSNINPYADFVMMIDDHVGQLVSAVKESGDYENTIIIFTSDNGCSPAAKINELIAKDHYPSGVFRGHKADIYEGGNRVPFILSWPSMISSGKISSQLISTVDLVATVADIVDYDLAEKDGVDSYSFLKVLDNKNVALAERKSAVMHSINGSFAIREGDWKLILCGGSGGWSKPKPGDSEVLAKLPKYQLYNLADDPSEENNLFEKESEIAANMQTILEQIVVNGRSTDGTKQENHPGSNGWPQIEKIGINAK